MSDTQNYTKPSLLARSVENLSTVLAVWHRSYQDRLIHAGVGDALVPTVLLLLVQAFDYRVLQPQAAFNIQVLQSLAGGIALSLLALALMMSVLHKDDSLWQVMIGVLWALVLGNVASTAALAASDANSLTDWMVRRFGVVYVFPLVFLGFRLGRKGVLAFLGFILPTAFVAAPWFVSLGSTPTDSDVAIFNPDIEMIYAEQGDLIAAQTQRLRPGVPGKPELFAVLGAGYPFEDVFRREVEAVTKILADRFNAKDRVISLVNDDADLASYPLMNRVNLTAALNAMARVMNPEDVAFLFLTSHGSPDVFSTHFYEVITRDMTSTDVNAALKSAGVGNAVIVLSACYSGSFAEELAAPDRLVLTAADADSASFGCNDQNEWTDWGRAFFVEALAETGDFREAARLAQESVTAREADEDRAPSSPQIIEGAKIGLVLDAWMADQN